MAAPSAVTRWAPLAQKYGRRYGIPAATLLGLIQVESGGVPGRTSSAGAQGLTQFMPGTARQYKVKIGDPASEIRGAAQYLSDLGYSRNPLHALGAYNGGPGNPQLGYAKSVLGAASSYGGSAGPAPTPTAGSPSALPDPSPIAGLASLLQRPTGQVSAPQAPSFSAQVSTPKGYTPPPGVATQPTSDLRQQLSQLLQADSPPPYQPGALAPSSGLGTRAGSYGAPKPGKFIGGYPLATRGKIIGVPYQGTHTLGNWQSDNAVDIAVPVGTPIYAEQDGTISRAGPLSGQGGSGGGRFSGDRVQLDGQDNSYWYGHLSRLTVKVGERVKRGQVIGYSGEANGVAHLHFAIRRGDPRKLVR